MPTSSGFAPSSTRTATRRKREDGTGNRLRGHGRPLVLTGSAGHWWPGDRWMGSVPIQGSPRHRSARDGGSAARGCLTPQALSWMCTRPSAGCRVRAGICMSTGTPVSLILVRPGRVCRCPWPSPGTGSRRTCGVTSIPRRRRSPRSPACSRPGQQALTADLVVRAAARTTPRNRKQRKPSITGHMITDSCQHHTPSWPGPGVHRALVSDTSDVVVMYPPTRRMEARTCRRASDGGPRVWADGGKGQ